MSLDLKWVPCRQHIYGSYFCNHLASLCLLGGAFNPFTFEVILIIGSYGHFANCLGIVFIGLSSFSLSFVLISGSCMIVFSVFRFLFLFLCIYLL